MAAAAEIILKNLIAAGKFLFAWGENGLTNIRKSAN
jgi:hypothetical protein